MSITLDGTNGITAPNVFGRNILINGDFRINQRSFNGDWSGLSDGDYGFDRWKRQDASTIRQVVEAGNFEPNAVHTLSGTNITTTQITSPSSGNWNIDVPNNADRIQLELGTIATPFERRFVGIELALCQRYFEKGTLFMQSAVAGFFGISNTYAVEKRLTPTRTGSVLASNSLSNITIQGAGNTLATFQLNAEATGNGGFLFYNWQADAEL